MENLTDLFLIGGNLIMINLTLQITLLVAAALLICHWFKYHAVWRYSILFATMMGTGLLCLTSVLLQSKATHLVNIPITLPHLGFNANSLPTGLLADIFQQSESALQPTRLEEAGNSGAAWLVSENRPSLLQRFPQVPVFYYLLWIWLLGVLLTLVGLARGLYKLRRWRAESRCLTVAQGYKVDQCLRSLGELNEVQCRISNQPISPMLVGIINPVILLPKGLIEVLRTDRLAAILEHEIAHLQRQDVLANLLQKFVLAWFWFHPLLHKLDRNIARAREEICDNHVLARQGCRAYGETLLLTSEYLSQQPPHSGATNMAMSIFDKHWKLEHRIIELLDQARGTSTAIQVSAKRGVYFATLLFALLLAASQLTPVKALESGPLTNDSATNPLSQNRSVADIAKNAIAVTYLRNDELQRLQQNQASSAETLSDDVLEAISEISELMSPDDESVAADLNGAKAKLDELYQQRFESMNDFEKSTILNFFTNYYLTIDDLPGALRIFEQMLTIESLRPDIRLRALRSLGQLYGAEEQWRESIRNYENWRELSDAEDPIVYRGLAYGHYQLQELATAIPLWLAYMELAEVQGRELSRNDYVFLFGLQTGLEDNSAALETTQQMIRLFNSPTDWMNLMEVYRNLGDEESSMAIQQAYELIFREQKTGQLDNFD